MASETPAPNLRQLLELGRPVQDFAQALHISFRLIEAAISAEAGMDQATLRAQKAMKEAQEIEERRGRLAATLEVERQTLLAPIRQELARMEGEGVQVRKRIEEDKRLLDEERGRRTSILRGLDEQIAEARRATDQQLQAVRTAAKQEEDRIKSDLARLSAQVEEAQRGLDQLRADYRGVQEAAAKLAGRR